MPEGKYKGVRMIDIPAQYLLWVYENKRCSKSVKAYVENNLDVLRQER